MKAILEFDLPEDQRDYDVVHQAQKVQSFFTIKKIQKC